MRFDIKQYTNFRLNQFYVGYFINKKKNSYFNIIDKRDNTKLIILNTNIYKENE